MKYLKWVYLKTLAPYTRLPMIFFAIIKENWYFATGNSVMAFVARSERLYNSPKANLYGYPVSYTFGLINSKIQKIIGKTGRSPFDDLVNDMSRSFEVYKTNVDLFTEEHGLIALLTLLEDRKYITHQQRKEFEVYDWNDYVQNHAMGKITKLIRVKTVVG